MAKISDRNASPPKFTPGTTSPLDRTAHNFASRVSIESAEEQRRAEQLSGSIAANNRAPKFGDVLTPPPFPRTTRIAVDPAPGEKAGGSKS